MKNIFIIYNRFDIKSVIAAAFLYSSTSNVSKLLNTTVKAISSDSGEIFPVTEDPNYQYVFIGISEVSKRFEKTKHTLIVSDDYYNVFSQVYDRVKNTFSNEVNEDFYQSSIYFRELSVALNMFHSKDASYNELSLCLNYYMMALKVLNDDGEWNFIEEHDVDNNLFDKFIKELKLKFKTNFSRNNPFTLAEGITHASASISDV